MLKKIFAFLLILFACVALSWGNITVGGDTNPELAGLNRDTDKVQEITKDEITGSLDSSITVDNRVFSKSGREQIAKQHEDFVDNVEQIGDGLRNNIVTKSIENAYTDKTKDIIDTIGDYIEQDRQMTELQQKHQDLVKALNGLTNYESAEARDILQQVADFVAGTDGFSGDLKLANIDGDVIGFAYQSNDGSVKNISLNLANIDMTDPNALMNALYHETTNFDQHTKNEQTAKNRGDTGSGIFDLKNYGNENTNDTNKDNRVFDYNDSTITESGNMTFIKDVISGANGTGTTNYSTYGDLDIDGKKLVITAVDPTDGSTAIIDNATKKVIANSKHVTEFIMYDHDDNIVATKSANGAAVGNIIHLDVDISNYVNSKVKQADSESLKTVISKVSDYGEYDIKNRVPKDYGLERNVPGYDYHYDGYMQDGKVVSGRSAGNDTFGRIIQNLSWPNAISVLGADIYQSMGYAKQSTKQFINDASNINTFEDLKNIQLPRLWFPESQEAKSRIYEGAHTQEQINSKNK